MPRQDLETRILRAALILQSRGLTQKEIATSLNSSQSQVSRVLAGQSAQRSKLAEALCVYAENLDTGVSLKAVMQNVELLDAVRQAWDGSSEHARALSAVIRSLAVLGRARAPSE